MAVVSHIERKQARTARDLYDQIREELDRSSVSHNEEMAGLRVVAETRLTQLKEARTNLEMAWVEAQVFRAQFGDLQERLESSKTRVREAEIAWQKFEDDDGSFCNPGEFK